MKSSSTTIPETNRSGAEMWRFSAEDLVRHGEDDVEHGLATEEARHRLSSQGANELPESPPPALLSLFLSQFTSVIVWVLIGGASGGPVAYVKSAPDVFLSRYIYRQGMDGTIESLSGSIRASVLDMNAQFVHHALRVPGLVRRRLARDQTRIIREGSKNSWFFSGWPL